MNEILPWLKCRLQQTVLKTTTTTETTTSGSGTLHLDDHGWFYPQTKVVLAGDKIHNISGIDPETKRILVSPPLSADLPSGSTVAQLRAVHEPPTMYIGNFQPAINPPVIRIYGHSEKV